MLYRYAVAFLFVAIVAGACSQPQDESVSPETIASTTIELGVTLIRDTASVATAIQESEAIKNDADYFRGIYAEFAPLIDDAIKACTGEESLILGSNCAPKVRGICNSGKQSLATHENDLQPGDGSTVKFICDLAALAEAIELVFVLNARYLDRFVPVSSYEDCRFNHDSEAEDLSLFYAIIDFWEYQLWYLFFVSFDHGTVSAADIVIPCMVVERGYNVQNYENISDAMRERLEPLFEAISGIWISNRYLNEQLYSENESTRDLPLVQENDESSLSELEYHWRQLSHVCATAEPVSEISTKDTCRLVAAIICEQHSILSTETEQVKPWYSQSPKNPEVDFACALAEKNIL